MALSSSAFSLTSLRSSLAVASEKLSEGLAVAHRAAGKASGVALQVGEDVCGAAAEAVASLRAEDPEDVRGTVVCSELAGPLRIKPGEGYLEVIDCWFGHPHRETRRLDLTAEAQRRVTRGNSLEIPATIFEWGNPAPECLKVLSVTYRRHGGTAKTPGERLRLQVAQEAMAQIMARATYEALKQIAGSPAVGSWICATPTRMGVPVPGASVHAIYVSTAELIFWEAKRGVRSESYLEFIRALGVAEMHVMQRPADEEAASQIIQRAHQLLPDEGSNLDGDPKRFHDGHSFAAHCHGCDKDVDASELAKTAGVTGAAVLAAAHIDEAAAVIALPLLGPGAAVAVGAVGALVVSPVLLAGLWKVQRSNDARLGLAVMNLTSAKVSVRLFKLDDSRRMDWGPVRSSCAGLGGRTSGDVETQQLLELNPPSSSDIFQLQCSPARCSADAASTQEARAAQGDVEEIDSDLTCLQSVTRGSVYWILQYGSALVVKEVPRHLIPAFTPSEQRDT